MDVLVAYDFAPHGITFAKPLVFTLSFRARTSGYYRRLLKLGYYSDPSLPTAVGETVSQLLGETLNLLSWTFTSTSSTSGYMIGTARDDSTM